MSRSAAAPHQLALHVGNLAFSVSERVWLVCHFSNQASLLVVPFVFVLMEVKNIACRSLNETIRSHSVCDLKRIFGKCGEVNEVKLMTDPRTKESRGFGFVNRAQPSPILAYPILSYPILA